MNSSKAKRTETEAIEDSGLYRHGSHVAAEAVDSVIENSVRRSAESFAGAVDTEAGNIVHRRGVEPMPGEFSDGRTDGLRVAEAGFRHGRDAGLFARPGKSDAGDETIEGAAYRCELNARQYSGHVPAVIYGHGGRESLWHCYERAVTAGIESVRYTPFGDAGPVVYETDSAGLSVREAIRDRLRIEPKKGGRPAWDGAIPRGTAERLREIAGGDVRPAFHFIYSYATGSLGTLRPWTETGVELLRAYNEQHGSRYESPARVARVR